MKNRYERIQQLEKKFNKNLATIETLRNNNASIKIHILELRQMTDKEFDRVYINNQF